MLVLTRKLGEEVVIGDNTRLTVLSIRGNKVKLGFTAPPETRVWRMELRARLDKAGGQGPQAADSPANSASRNPPARLSR